MIGGIGYASSAVYPVGTALGLIHLAVGLADLFAGYAFLRRRAWSPALVVAMNGVTIAYSAFSEAAAQIYSLLPPGINDSLIGTLIAIVVSGTIIFLVRRRSTGAQVLKKTISNRLSPESLQAVT